MNPTSAQTTSGRIPINIRIAQSRLQRFLDEKQITIPIGDRYHLESLKVRFQPGSIALDALIAEKKKSQIELICAPKWDAEQQRFFIENLEFQTHSKNILLKSAGWFASTFMSTKLDKKIEETANRFFQMYKDKIIANPIHIPMDKIGMTAIQVDAIEILDITLDTGFATILVNATGKISTELK